jgi:GDPmannose 4,6-dehydratase/GDP-4-dehydro-6-deoxy-D-mannose reductase
MIDVRDAMTSYWIAAESCTAGEAYNIGGKTVITVGELLGTLTRMATRPIPLKLDPGLLRPADVTLQIPDTRKFQRATGWEPRYSFAESMEHLLEYWRRRSREESGTG